MRVDEDAAFRTREAAKSAARDSPNILAWESADLLLDGLFAAERREPLPGLPAASRASTYRPRVSVPAIKLSFASAKTRIGSSPAITMKGTGACAAFILFQPTDLVSKGTPTSTAPAVVLTALAVARLAVEVAMRLMPHYKMWSAIRNDLISIALSWSLLRFGSQNQPERRSPRN
jgi:hypothetical protein